MTTPADHFACGDMVVCPDGRVGMIVVLSIRPQETQVAFGSSGPYKSYFWRRLRHATLEDVRRAGLDGVGGRTIG